jgi:DNA-binding SARP family transcriptional activator
MGSGQILEARLLGGFRLSRDGQPVETLAQARLRHLLAYLLLQRDSPVPRHQLAFALWPDTTEEQAHSNLRNLLHRLAEALPESRQLLAIERRAICWRPGHALTLDADEFAAALARATGTRRESCDDLC